MFVFVPMKIISWNVQGLNGVQVMQEIKILTRIHKPNMIFLLETMVNETNLLRILPTFGFGHFDYVLPHNHSGDIVVLWNNGDIHASILSKEHRAIHMLVFYNSIQKLLVISGIMLQLNFVRKKRFGHIYLNLTLL